MASNLMTAGNGIVPRFVKYWLPVFLMVGLMYYASTDVLSGENTRGVIEKILAWLAVHASPRMANRLNFVIRKTAHLTEYALLAWLLFRAFRADSLSWWRLRWAIYSLGICVTWSLLDELHQTFTRTRGGSINDSMLDSLGALISLTTIAVSASLRKTPRFANRKS